MSASAIFETLAKEHRLRGTDLQAFTARAAYYLGEINAIHPFREGNGRTQREFIRELGVACGYVVAWEQASRADMIAASAAAFVGDLLPLGALIRNITASRNAQMSQDGGGQA